MTLTSAFLKVHSSLDLCDTYRTVFNVVYDVKHHLVPVSFPLVLIDVSTKYRSKLAFQSGS